MRHDPLVPGDSHPGQVLNLDLVTQEAVRVSNSSQCKEQPPVSPVPTVTGVVSVQAGQWPGCLLGHLVSDGRATSHPPAPEMWLWPWS